MKECLYDNFKCLMEHLEYCNLSTHELCKNISDGEEYGNKCCYINFCPVCVNNSDCELFKGGVKND